MAYLIGIDEAGYGPRLGPLVLAATKWEVVRSANRSRQGSEPHETIGNALLEKIDLYDVLHGVVTRDRPARPASGAPRSGSALRTSKAPIAIADSKRLYHSGGGVGTLERAVLAALAATGAEPANWRDLIRVLRADPAAEIDATPWYREFDCPIPIETQSPSEGRIAGRVAPRQLASGRSDLRGELPAVEARVVAVRARMVFAGEFNRLCQRHGNKASALTALSLELLAEMISPAHPNGNASSRQAGSTNNGVRRGTPTGDVAVFAVCDKHGGRNRYGAAIRRQFSDSVIDTRREGREESQYFFRHEGHAVDVRFRKGGEAFLPTALASMTAKYVREISMQALNQFWRGHVRDLKPTAGYPTDARRFQLAIAERQHALGIDDRILWRTR